MEIDFDLQRLYLALARNPLEEFLVEKVYPKSKMKHERGEKPSYLMLAAEVIEEKRAEGRPLDVELLTSIADETRWRESPPYNCLWATIPLRAAARYDDRVTSACVTNFLNKTLPRNLKAYLEKHGLSSAQPAPKSERLELETVEVTDKTCLRFAL